MQKRIKNWPVGRPGNKAVGNQHFVPYSEVSLNQGVSGIFPEGAVQLSLAVRW